MAFGLGVASIILLNTLEEWIASRYKPVLVFLPLAPAHSEFSSTLDKVDRRFNESPERGEESRNGRRRTHTMISPCTWY